MKHANHLLYWFQKLGQNLVNCSDCVTILYCQYLKSSVGSTAYTNSNLLLTPSLVAFWFFCEQFGNIQASSACSWYALGPGNGGMLNCQNMLSLNVLFELPFNSMGLLYGVCPSWFPLVVLHTKSIFFFHLWCMLRGGVWIRIKSNLFCSVEGQTHFSTSWHAKKSLTLNEHI